MTPHSDDSDDPLGAAPDASTEPTTPKRPDDEPKEPTLRRLIVNDSTFEALHQTMSENPAGVFVIRDELTGWLVQLEKPGREGERAFSLEAWDGSNSHTVDRIGRGTIHVPACCMSLLGGIQPGRLRPYLVDALRDGPSDDGLIQRFQLLVWPDTPPDWTYVDRAPDPESVKQIVRVFRQLVTLDDRDPARFLFAPDAQDLFVKWLFELETRIRADEMHPALVSHLSKYRSLMPSLAVLFELADRAARDDFDRAELARASNRVSLEHAKQAAAWCDYLESHARRVYSCVVTPQMRAARELAAKIKAHKVAARFSCRDVYLNAWSALDAPELVKLAAEFLIDAGWLREVPAESGPAGGRPSMRYDVNPKVWEMSGSVDRAEPPILAEPARNEPSKPTKLGFDGFDGADPGQSSEIAAVRSPATVESDKSVSALRWRRGNAIFAKGYRLPGPPQP